MPPISFNQVPVSGRVPFAYVEFDSSQAQQGPTIQPYKLLVLGMKIAAGTAVADVPVKVTSYAQAKALFGDGSMIQGQLKQIFNNNKSTEVTVIPQSADSAGVVAAGKLSFTGPATAAGTLSLLIAGQKITVGVASGDTATAIATAVQAALALVTELPVSAAIDGTNTYEVDLTAKAKGLYGNGIDVRHSYYDGESLPGGVGLTITAMASGTTAPSLANAINAMGEVQYNAIAFGYNDATSLSAIEAELLDRWGPVRQNDGIAFTAKDASQGTLATFGQTRNSKHVSCPGIYNCPTPFYEIGAGTAAVAAYYAQIDPARPFQTLPIIGILPPAEIDRFSLQERDLLLHDGIATLKVNADGQVCIERLITMYQLNSAGSADVAYLDCNTLFTLSYLRYDFRNMLATKYPRHKLANDGTRYGAGQAIITPKVGRAEAISKFRDWEDLGLVEGADQFKRDLIVERSVTDVNRLDFYLPPNLINQLIVCGVQIGFLL